MDWGMIIALATTLFGGGGIGWLLTIGAARRKADIGNMQSALDAMKKVCDERQEECARKDELIAARDKKIDSLYELVTLWRDRHGDVVAENTRLKVELATNEPKLCMVRGCGEREPESGY